MRQVISKALSAIGQRKSRPLGQKDRATEKPDGIKSQSASWDMSPEDALRIGTVANYK